jgi:hypothetical protein
MLLWHSRHHQHPPVVLKLQLLQMVGSVVATIVVVEGFCRGPLSASPHDARHIDRTPAPPSPRRPPSSRKVPEPASRSQLDETAVVVAAAADEERWAVVRAVPRIEGTQWGRGSPGLLPVCFYV